MSELEDLLKKHTGDVAKSLEEFEGKITTVTDLVKALEGKINVIPARPAVGRLLGPDTDDESGQRKSALIGARLSIEPEARKQMSDILLGKGMRENSDPDGGYLVPESLRADLESLILIQSPIRRVARIVDFSTPNTVLPVNVKGATAGWVGEGEDRDETAAPSLAAVTPPGGTVYALPTASEELVDDAIVNMEQFLEENVVDAIASKESSAFIFGDGIKKPSGFLGGNAPSLGTDETRAADTLQYVAAGLPDDLELLEALVGMIFATKAGYRQAPGVSWLASTAMIAKLAILRDSEGRLLYTPSLREGVPGLLLGYPVVECEHMDGISENSFPLAFGNWQRGYVIGDRIPLNVLRDPYTKKGQIQWYFRKRVHGAVLNHEAIKLLKIEAIAP